MHWDEWKPFYEEAMNWLNLDPEIGEYASDKAVGKGSTTLGKLGALDWDKTWVFGSANRVLKDINAYDDGLVVSTTHALPYLLESGINPDVVYTDLSCHLKYVFQAEAQGAVIVANVDWENMEHFNNVIQEFDLPLITTQGSPREGVHNFGGFTEEDRACFLAEHFGAKEIILAGFDFENAPQLLAHDLLPRKSPGLEKKKRFLQERLIRFLSSRVPMRKPL